MNTENTDNTKNKKIFPKPEYRTLKKPRLRQHSKIWLQRAESFKLFLEEHLQDPAPLSQHEQSYQDPMGQMLMEQHYRYLRERRYYLWLQKAEALMYLEPGNNPLKSGMMRLMISLDYKKLYDALLFEFHYYLSRACFCRLAQHYEVKLNPRVLNCELASLINHLKTLLHDNQGSTDQEDFKALYLHAYRSALIDLCLYHNIKTHVFDAPLFSLTALISSRFSGKVKKIKKIKRSNSFTYSKKSIYPTEEF
jgi:hypothetical protein